MTKKKAPQSQKAILISSDHAGSSLKAALKKLLPDINWKDLGPKEASTASVDYPDAALELTSRIAAGEADRGILICGTGIGMAITANKFQGIYAATAENPLSAKLAREHNHVNVLCLGARILAAAYAAEITQAWLDAKKSTEPRHVKRISLIEKYETEGLTS